MAAKGLRPRVSAQEPHPCPGPEHVGSQLKAVQIEQGPANPVICWLRPLPPPVSPICILPMILLMAIGPLGLAPRGVDHVDGLGVAVAEIATGGNDRTAVAATSAGAASPTTAAIGATASTVSTIAAVASFASSHRAVAPGYRAPRHCRPSR